MRKQDWKFLLTITAALLLSLAGGAGLQGGVDLEFVAETWQWEPGREYTVQLVLRNRTSEPARLAGLQADFAYDTAIFAVPPQLVEDWVKGYDFLVNVLDTDRAGEVDYIKGIRMNGQPNHLWLKPEAVQPLVELRFQVRPEAPVGVTRFRFRVTAALVARHPNGLTGDQPGRRLPAQITISPAPPQITE